MSGCLLIGNGPSRKGVHLKSLFIKSNCDFMIGCNKVYQDLPDMSFEELRIIVWDAATRHEIYNDFIRADEYKSDMFVFPSREQKKRFAGISNSGIFAIDYATDTLKYKDIQIIGYDCMIDSEESNGNLYTYANGGAKLNLTWREDRAMHMANWMHKMYQRHSAHYLIHVPEGLNLLPSFERLLTKNGTGYKVHHFNRETLDRVVHPDPYKARWNDPNVPPLAYAIRDVDPSYAVVKKVPMFYGNIVA